MLIVPPVILLIAPKSRCSYEICSNFESVRWFMYANKQIRSFDNMVGTNLYNNTAVCEFRNPKKEKIQNSNSRDSNHFRNKVRAETLIPPVSAMISVAVRVIKDCNLIVIGCYY